MIPVTPRGFKDVLPSEARWREAIVSATRRVLALWGYAPIETPTLEVLEVLEQGGELSSVPFRLFDTDNELLVLRPDVTLQVARMAASRLRAADLPLRLRYVERVYREEEGLKALSRQFTQIGVEAIGLAGPAADAEIVLVAVDALRAAKLAQFKVSMGTVAVLRQLLAAAEATGAVNAAWSAEMLAAFHAGNLVAIEALSRAQALDANLAYAFCALPLVTGKSEAIECARQLVAPLGIAGGLDELQATWNLIQAAGASQHVSIDFSVVSSYDYYTGLVFCAYAPGLGKALGSGGRYDRMLAGFGGSAAAAGFALSLEAIMEALVNQDAPGPEQTLAEPKRLAVNAAAPAEAFCEAARLRAEGCAVWLELGAAASAKEAQ